ncbi:MAG: putative metal-binding motif-containing protein [Chitinophagales bacterium]
MKHKILSCIIFFSLLITWLRIHAQAPDIQWQNTIGGNAGETQLHMVNTLDSCYFLGTSSISGLSGDKTENGFGGFDYWVMKLNIEGNIIWQKDFGGDGYDYLNSLQQTSDSGYILGGTSTSGISGNKSEANIGYNDYWVVKIDSIGDIEWENTIGGSFYDKLSVIKQTGDNGYINGYIIGGYSSSNISGDKTANAYIGGAWGYDYWIVKLDSNGIVLWDKTIGGDGDDYLTDILILDDGNYIIGGYSNSGISGDKTEDVIGVSGMSDYWILKIDEFGDVIWQNTIGGDQTDMLMSLEETDDGGFIAGGYSYSGISGDKAEMNFGFSDYWVFKCDGFGDIIWQNSIGGISDDFLHAVHKLNDGNFLLAGESNSGMSGDKTEFTQGGLDYWTIKLTAYGDILWQKDLGGAQNDYQSIALPTSDSGYILGGYSYSGESGDKTEPNIGDFGESDIWVIKLDPEDCTPLPWFADADEDGFGDADAGISSCVAPLGYVSDNTDCNDLEPGIHPGAIEICNDLDDDCNTLIDDGLPLFTYYADMDDDGYGDAGSPLTTCILSPPPGYTADNTDCDDSENLIHEPALFYADADNDLYGSADDAELFCTLFPPSGYVTNDLDCDDTNEFVNPLSNEICNATDDNCNGVVDEGLPTQILYADGDGDMYGNPESDTVTCMLTLEGFVSNDLDCDDENASIYPGAVEILNNQDDNCNGLVDEGLVDVENIAIDQINIYPNPNKGDFYIQYPDNTTAPEILAMQDAIGRNIHFTATLSGNLLHVEITLPLPRMIIIWLRTETESSAYFAITTN